MGCNALAFFEYDCYFIACSAISSESSVVNGASAYFKASLILISSRMSITFLYLLPFEGLITNIGSQHWLARICSALDLGGHRSARRFRWVWIAARIPSAEKSVEFAVGASKPFSCPLSPSPLAPPPPAPLPPSTAPHSPPTFRPPLPPPVLLSLSPPPPTIDPHSNRAARPPFPPPSCPREMPPPPSPFAGVGNASNCVPLPPDELAQVVPDPAVKVFGKGLGLRRAEVVDPPPYQRVQFLVDESTEVPTLAATHRLPHLGLEPLDGFLGNRYPPGLVR